MARISTIHLSDVAAVYEDVREHCCYSLDDQWWIVDLLDGVAYTYVAEPRESPPSSTP